jgi:hypothetical protein
MRCLPSSVNIERVRWIFVFWGQINPIRSPHPSHLSPKPRQLPHPTSLRIVVYRPPKISSASRSIFGFQGSKSALLLCTISPVKPLTQLVSSMPRRLFVAPLCSPLISKPLLQSISLPPSPPPHWIHSMHTLPRATPHFLSSHQ